MADDSGPALTEEQLEVVVLTRSATASTRWRWPSTTSRTSTSALHADYTQIAIDRLIDVIVDSEPDQTTGPQPA